MAPDYAGLLLVDAANVVGSRPDGWWRDRAGAARRLVYEIRAAVAAGRIDVGVIVVLEGAARRGVPEGSDGPVLVVHARGSGDDAIASMAAEQTEPLIVVTADRGLRARVERDGVTLVGPSWLRDRL